MIELGERWRDFADVYPEPERTVTGTVKVLEALYSPQLDNRRDLLVYLPPSYGRSEARYPVLYMHDGQNLFDYLMSYAGEWGVDETLQALSNDGIEAIVVGIANLGLGRIHEYNPFADSRPQGGRGEPYLAFIVETVKPLIDQDFRTCPERAATGILGSSLGGLISLYGFFRYPQVFGLAGAMSPSLWFGDGAIFAYVRGAPYVPGKIYLDVGNHEGPRSVVAARLLRGYASPFVRNVQRMRDLLEAKGYRMGRDLLYVEDPDGVHHESAWGRRLPDALRFLLG